MQQSDDAMAISPRASAPACEPLSTPPATPTAPIEAPPTLDLTLSKLEATRPEVTYDCAICSSPMEDPAVGGGCAHHFCYPCYTSWVDRKPSCPTCRAPVWAITHDYEFAKLIGAECSTSHASPNAAGNHGGDDMRDAPEEAPDPTAPRRVALPAPAGLTIANAPGGNGCIVTRVVRGNGGHLAGIRVGDVIIAVNATAVRDHQTAVEFIERRCRVGDCEVVLKGKRPSVGKRLVQLAREVSVGVAPFAPSPLRRVQVRDHSPPLETA